MARQTLYQQTRVILKQLDYAIDVIDEIDLDEYLNETNNVTTLLSYINAARDVARLIEDGCEQRAGANG